MHTIWFTAKVKITAILKCDKQWSHTWIKSWVKYLGATIDQCLIFESMARSVIKKANYRLNFYTGRNNFLHTILKHFWLCHFDYASPVWFYGLTIDLKSKLQVTRNKLIMFVMNSISSGSSSRSCIITLKR